MPSPLLRRHCSFVGVSLLLLLLLACAFMPPLSAQVIDTPRTLYRIAGGANLPGNLDGIGPEARFFLPRGIVGTNDALWVVDQSIHSLRRIDPNGRVETVIGEHKMCGKNDGPKSAALFCFPSAIVSDSEGTLYIADFINHTIRKFQGGSLTTVAGVASLCGRRDTLMGSSPCFPTALAIHDQHLYVTDGLSVIYRIDIPTGEAKAIAGKDRCASRDGTGEAAGFCSPQGIAIDRVTGMLYVTDTDNHTIRKVTPEGMVSTFAGKAQACGNADGKEAARFCAPHGIAIDSAGNLYVADRGRPKIRKITPDGLVSTVAGTVENYRTILGDLPGAIDMPIAIAVIGENQLAITTARGEILGINF